MIFNCVPKSNLPLKKELYSHFRNSVRSTLRLRTNCDLNFDDFQIKINVKKLKTDYSFCIWVNKYDEENYCLLNGFIKKNDEIILDNNKESILYNVLAELYLNPISDILERLDVDYWYSE